MRNLVIIAALTAAALTGCNQSAQSAQNADSSGGAAATATFSPEVRAQFERIRSDARTASLSQLSPASRTAAIAAAKQFDSGDLSMPEAANKIDATLTPQETTAMLGESKKMREQMRAAFASSGSAAPAFGRRGGATRTPDAGRFLMQVLASPEKLRAAMRAGAPPTTSPQ